MRLCAMRYGAPGAVRSLRDLWWGDSRCTLGRKPEAMKRAGRSSWWAGDGAAPGENLSSGA